MHHPAMDTMAATTEHGAHTHADRQRGTSERRRRRRPSTSGSASHVHEGHENSNSNAHVLAQAHTSKSYYKSPKTSRPPLTENGSHPHLELAAPVQPWDLRPGAHFQQ